MVKKGGKLPAGHINDWFWEDKSMQDYIATRLPKGMGMGHGHCRAPFSALQQAHGPQLSAHASEFVAE